MKRRGVTSHASDMHSGDAVVTYGITRVAGGEQRFIEVDKDLFHASGEAKDNLVTALVIEEKLVLLLENYEEFEKVLLDSALHRLIFRSTSWSDYISHLYASNRRLVNLLTACRLYVDHIQHDLNSIYGADCAAGEEIRAIKSVQYDTSFAYRVMEALRNYVQHRGLPIHSFGFSGRWHDMPSRVARNSAIPRLSVSRIRKDGGFKQTVLTELEAAGDLVDLRPLVREYVAGIGTIHMAVRQQLASDVAKWDNLFESVQQQFSALNPPTMAGLAVVSRNSAGEFIDEVPILPDLITRRRWLQRRAVLLTHFAKHVITNEVDRREDEHDSE